MHLLNRTRLQIAALNPSMSTATAGAILMPSSVLAIAQSRVAEPIRRLDAPDPVWPVYLASFERDGHSWQISIDPATGRVPGLRDQERSLAAIIYGVHSAFLLDEWGGTQVVGALGFVLMVSAATGLYLWWPSAGFWRALRTLRWRPKQRFYLDLHGLAGAWTSVVLLVVAFSGVALVYPGLIESAVSLALPAAPFPRPRVQAQAIGYRIDADEALSIARAAAPETDLNFLEIAAAPANVWRVSLRWRGQSAANHDGPSFWIDAWEGRVVASAGYRDSLGDRFMALQSVLHNGALLAMPGRVLVFVSGLAPLALFVTGVLAWIRKRYVRTQLSARKDAVRRSS